MPEYSFAVDVSGQELDLSHEHDKVRWLSFKEAMRLLTWESNRIALWELNERLNTDQIDELLTTDDGSRPPGHDNVYAIKEKYGDLWRDGTKHHCGSTRIHPRWTQQRIRRCK